MCVEVRQRLVGGLADKLLLVLRFRLLMCPLLLLSRWVRWLLRKGSRWGMVCVKACMDGRGLLRGTAVLRHNQLTAWPRTEPALEAPAERADVQHSGWFRNVCRRKAVRVSCSWVRRTRRDRLWVAPCGGCSVMHADTRGLIRADARREERGCLPCVRRPLSARRAAAPAAAKRWCEAVAQNAVL